MEEQAATQEAPEPGSKAATTPAWAPAANLAPVAGGGDVRLSREEAEQVIRRALELQDAQQVGGDPGLSLADVQDIARQLGVDPALVRRARTEVRVATQAPATPQRAEWLLGPAHVEAARLVPGEAKPVRSASAQWMTQDEGMTCVGTRGHTDRWVRDKRLLVQLRRGLQADRGTGVLRDLDAVSVTILPDPEGAIVTVDADTKKVRTSGGVIAGVGTLISAGVAVGATAIAPDSAAIGADAGQFAAAFIPSVAITLGTALSVTRTWSSKVRRAVDQALDGIALTTASPQLPPPPVPADTGWRGTMMRWLGGQG